MIETRTTTHAGAHVLGFVLDAEHEAHQPPEVSAGRRDQVRLLVSDGEAAPVHARFDALGDFLRAGDLVVVNTSATVPAAVDARMPDGDPVVVHFSGELPGGVLLVEVRQPAHGTTAPRVVDAPAELDLLGLGRVQLHARFADSQRLWLASATFADGASLLDFLDGHGRPIRYRHVPREWPIEAYQTVFAREPGSVEMPSAARPFSTELVTDLVGRGIGIVPLVLHTGVSSLEGEERPYPERYRVPRADRDRDRRDAPEWRASDRHRHHRRPRSGHRHRRSRRRAPRCRLDRPDGHRRHAGALRSTASSPDGTNRSRRT